MRELGPSTTEQVYDRWREVLERLQRMRTRAGESWSDLGEVQLRTTEAFVDDLGRVLFGTNGHGRILHPEEATA